MGVSFAYLWFIFIVSPVPIWVWIAFHAVVFTILALDLGVINRQSHTQTVKSALLWTAFWIALSMGFAGVIWKEMGHQKGVEFVSGYLVEYALSVDNIFVFLLVFGYFHVPPEHQHKVLFWGIIGAFIMRAAMIFAGTFLIEQFEWIIYIFGVFLIYTGFKLAFGKDAQVDPGKNPAVNLLRRVIPVTPSYVGGQFLTKIDGRNMATPLMAVLVVIETTDLIFAVDSIPAIFAVVKSRDPFIIYTSNICAILGLRSLYFAVAGIMDLFHYLKFGLAFVLSFVGVKMLLSHTRFEIPSVVSLCVILLILGGSILLSILRPKRGHNAEPPARFADKES